MRRKAGRGIPRAGARAILVLVLILFGVPGRPVAPAGGERPRPPDPPDILLLTIDTLRPDHLPFFGGRHDNAPFLSSLARGAVLYPSAFSTSSWTVPAVTSMLSGLYPISHGVTHGSVLKGAVVNQEILAADVPTLAEFLKRAGYATAAVVANAHLNPGTHFDRGFDRYVPVGFSPADSVNFGVRQLRPLLQSRDRPLFLWLHYFDPHHPYIPREPWVREYCADMTAAEFIEMAGLQSRWADFERAAGGNRKRMLDIARGHYDSEIRYLDERLREMFAEFPRLDAALILFTADHGEELMEHGFPTHGRNLHDTTIRIPFFIRPPGGGAPDTIRSAVSLVDVAPTLLAAAGGAAPRLWSGTVVWRDGRAVPPPEERRVLAELDRIPKQAIHKAFLSARWKVIHEIDRKRTRLFDRGADPGERKDLAPADPARADELLREMRRFIADLPRSRTRTDPRALSPEQQELLRSLGYLN